MQQLSQLNQLVLEVAVAARQRFPKSPLRVWYVMLGDKSWKVIVINTVNKVKLTEGPIRTTLNGALSACKAQLEKTTTKESSGS